MSYEVLIWLAIGLMVVNLLLLLWIRSAAKGAQSSNDVLGPVVREEFRIVREDMDRTARELREEITQNQNSSTELLQKIGNAQSDLLEKFTRSNESRISELRESVEKRLETLQRNNDEKLEEMRKTVEDKLQDTLKKRVTESFEMVSKQLEQVHKSVGEMQELATGVGDLKRMLTNVKARGTWGEVQLGVLLEQVLIQQQYERNVKPVPGSNEIVEFAVKLPGADDSPESVVWLPIDAKFPQEDYNRLMDASESADPDAVQKAVAALKKTVESSAADIRSKYVAPPHTTDFAILFLPTEGLYAELVRDPDVLEKLQRDHRVVLAGPTTLSAILNSLQMGFRTLAIEKRSSEVWTVLSAVKSEFGKFGDALDKVKKQLATASNSIEATGTRTRQLQRKLRSVEELPAEADPAKILGISAGDLTDASDETEDSRE